MFKRFRILPLDADDSSKFLPWTIAFMTYLAGLALAGALALTAVTSRFEAGQSSTLTVEIPPSLTEADGDTKTNGKKTDKSAAKIPAKDGMQQTRLDAALELLRTTPGVIAAEALERAEVASLLKPWLGEAADDPDLPLPDVIDVLVHRIIAFSGGHSLCEFLLDLVQRLFGRYYGIFLRRGAAGDSTHDKQEQNTAQEWHKRAAEVSIRMTGCHGVSAWLVRKKTMSTTTNGAGIIGRTGIKLV